MRWGVVLVEHDSGDLLGRCLDAVRAEQPDDVLVVDHGTVPLVPPVGARVLRRPNDGFAAGVNAGLRATDAPVVVLLNPDTLPAPGALRRLVDHLAGRPGCGVAAPRLVDPDGRPQATAYRRDPGLGLLALELCLPLGALAQRLPALDPYRVPPSAWRPGRRVAHAAGAALAVRRTAWEEAGPLDEGYFLYLEETEWQCRVRAAGWGVELVPDAVVTHHVRGGGAAALAPSPHFVVAAGRYLALRGHRPLVVRAVLGAALATSRGTSRVAAALPGADERRRALAAGWARLRV